MINGINLRNLRNAEYLQFMKDTLTLTNANNPVALNIQAQYQALLGQVTDLDTLFRVSQASELSQEILDIDTRRDRAVSGLRQVIEGYASHYEPAKASAAQLLKNNMALYGTDIERQNYMAQTATLHGIVSDWETKPELDAAVLLLGLKAWKEEMKAANRLFNEKYLERTQQYGAANDETLTSEKAQTNELYYILRDNIAAHATLDTSGAYARIVGELNALIMQYNVLLHNREARTERENPPVQE